MRVWALIVLVKILETMLKTSAKENLGYHRLKHNKPWFDDECSISRPTEAGSITVVAKSKPNQWRQCAKFKM
jgi:hypothetical protein